MANPYRFNLSEINNILGELRNNLRDGKARVNWAEPNALRRAVASALGIMPEDFSTQYFNKNTLARFSHFFTVPRGPNLSWRNPTPDETAWALQNFINRRAEPWQAFRNRMQSQDAVGNDEIEGEALLKALDALNTLDV